MIRLGIAVEGKTEIEFVNSVLVQHFLELDITAFALPVGRQISHKSVGGNISIPRLSHQMSLLYWSSEYVTSFVDFYGFVRKGAMSVDQLERQLKKEVRKRISTSGTLEKSYHMFKCMNLKACYFLMFRSSIPLGNLKIMILLLFKVLEIASKRQKILMIVK